MPKHSEGLFSMPSSFAGSSRCGDAIGFSNGRSDARNRYPFRGKHPLRNGRLIPPAFEGGNRCGSPLPGREQQNRLRVRTRRTPLVRQQETLPFGIPHHVPPCHPGRIPRIRHTTARRTLHADGNGTCGKRVRQNCAGTPPRPVEGPHRPQLQIRNADARIASPNEKRGVREPLLHSGTAPGVNTGALFPVHGEVSVGGVG